MIFLIEILLCAVAIIFLIPCVFLLFECAAASTETNRVLNTESIVLGATPGLAIMIPAHNEAEVIGETLENVLQQVENPQLIHVVADNCSDDTAKIARSYGVDVIERDDQQLWGKGYGLDYGLKRLSDNPPEVVIFIDADCYLSPKTIDILAHTAVTTGRPVQGTYLMEQPDQPTPKDSISILAIIVKNLVRPLGLDKMGFSCLHTGSGMAIPWLALNQVNLATNKSNEDMKLSVDLALKGYPPLFCPRVEISGRLRKGQGALKQRSRWEHSHLETFLVEAPILTKGAIGQKRWDLLALALEIAILPLSLMVMVWLAGMMVSIAFTVITGYWIHLFLMSLGGICIFLALFIAWFNFAREKIPAKTLLSIPLYIFWKIPLYFAFLFEPQTGWNKKERDQSS
ncbi:MAG: hypothetical protein N5P05_002497 [Chroococcopsis gigantea SAG 12.99]|jgi:cellulose synthase/poly-beta-1,6-N-acetylglucosamine synthase-like glycosyltransferase|nr:hypothetical protein [Chroococcopsis gigantea SAG 12.99]